MATGILFLLVLVVVVVVHEAGHFFAAKSVNIRVKEFAFGFPPRLFSIKRGETEYSINALPLGGYVSMDGENGLTENPDPRHFSSKSRLAQAWVLIAGPLMNIVLAFILLAISFMSGYGTKEQDAKLVILSVAKDSPADKADIQSGDRALSLFVVGDKDPIRNPDAEAFRQTIERSQGKQVAIEIQRGQEAKIVYVSPEQSGDSHRVGVGIGELAAKKLGFFAAIREGAIVTGRMTKDTVMGFANIIKSAFTGGNVKESLTGPIGIAKEVGTASRFGFAYLLSFVALISINLGILNMFPFPALDGGRLLFLVIEKIKGSRISPKVSNIINTIGFGVLIVLMITITVKDIIRLF